MSMDLGLRVLTGADDLAPEGAAVPKTATPPPVPKPVPTSKPKDDDLLTTEAKPLTGTEFRDHLVTAATYSMLFGIGLGALSEQKEAAMGLIKLSMVLAIPAGAIWVAGEE